MMASLVSGLGALSLRPQHANPRARYASDEEKMALRANLTARIVGRYSVITPLTMSNGDCLYSSVYRAALAQNLRCVIDNILVGYNGPMPGNVKAGLGSSRSTEEIVFVQKARFLVSEEATGEIEQLYYTMVNNFENNKDIYDEMVGTNTTFVEETLALIKRYIGGARSHADRMINTANFIREYKNNVINLDATGNIPDGWRIYSGELENNALTRLIKRMCGINVITISSELNTKEIQVQPDTIYIENQGGGHYEYFEIRAKVPDRDPRPDEVIARAAKIIKKDIINAIIKESKGNLDRIIDKIIEVYGGNPFGLNRQLNTNFSDEYLRLRNGRPPPSASAAKPPPKPTSAPKPPPRTSSMSLRSSVMTRNSKIAQLMAKGATNVEAEFALNASANNVSQAERLLRSQGVKLSGGRRRTQRHRKTKKRHF
jgi:hypothetical protein